MKSIKTAAQYRAARRGWGGDGSSLEAGGMSGADPLGFAAGDANLYSYVGNSPGNFTDPSGLQRAELSRPTDPNAITSDQFKAIVFPALKGYVPPTTPTDQLPFKDYFESAAIRMLMLNKYSRQTDTPFNSAERAAKPNGRSKVLPDATSVVTDVTKKKRARLYRDSCFVDAKYGSSKLYAFSYGYEPVGHADVLSKSPAANAGVLPLMIYVATADTPIYQNCVDEYTKRKVLVAQSYMAKDPKTGKLYLTSPIILNPGLLNGLPLPGPAAGIGYTPDWELINPKFEK